MADEPGGRDHSQSWGSERDAHQMTMKAANTMPITNPICVLVLHLNQNDWLSLPSEESVELGDSVGIVLLGVEETELFHVQHTRPWRRAAMFANGELTSPWRQIPCTGCTSTPPPDED